MGEETKKEELEAKEHHHSKPHHKKSWLKRHTTLLIILGIIFVLILFFFGAKIWLYLNLALGNDIIVGLQADKENFQLLHGEEEKVAFTAKVTTNPFCTAICNYQFKDISKNLTLEEDQFTLRPTNPLKREYLLQAKEWGSGLYLYRFDLDCHSQSTFFCHTTEEPATRSVLITLSYDLAAEEKELQLSLLEKLTVSAKKLDLLPQQISLAKDREWSDKLSSHQKKLTNLKREWSKSDLDYLSEEIVLFEEEVNNFEKGWGVVWDEFVEQSRQYNQMINKLVLIKDNLQSLQDSPHLSLVWVEEVKNLSREFNSIANSNNLLGLQGETLTLENNSNLLLARELLPFLVEINHDKEILCGLGNCLKYYSIEELAELTNFTIAGVCQEVKNLRTAALEFNDSLTSPDYPETLEFWNSVNLKIKNLKQNLTNHYFQDLPQNKTNSLILSGILSVKELSATEEYPTYNLTSALTQQFLLQLSEECLLFLAKKINLTNVTFTPINLEIKTNVTFILAEPTPQCPIFGKPQACCFDCREKNYPIVFLHGHALSKDVSAEYSLEGFNEIQKRLEEDGYLNAGTITLYTAKDSPAGLLGEIPAPLTFRGSYYFDVFKQPENYVLVETKSENIDTYAIRLKDLLETIEYKTGKKKVVLMGFSMGGVVARRYLQLFGPEKVDRLIMIGTPNKGTVGTIAEVCPLTGAELECRDLRSDSLLMNKLNTGTSPKIPVFNIVGTGCNMEGKQGDGAVLEENAKLDWATNFVIKGKCRSVTYPLHLDLRNLQLYPEVYEKIKVALE